jgi:NAD(P)-dependent dehydrogenase (short-subunit alcohol dehydrogenase family)
MPAHPFDLIAKVALITGGNSGIGQGMAKALAAAGANVAIWGTNVAKNAAARDVIALNSRRRDQPSLRRRSPARRQRLR